MSNEEWRGVPHFPSYEISSLGRVRRGIGKRNWPAGKILKASNNSRGYLSVCLRDEGKSYPRTIHSLVAEAFLGPCPAGHCVHHKDGNGLNNSKENLEYMMACRHYEEYAKLSTEDVAKIKELHAAGMSSRNIARIYNTSASNIRSINGGASWKRIGCDLPKTYIKPGSSKLNREQVEEIKELHESGMKQVEIAKIFKIHPSTVSLIIRNIRWQRD